MRQQLSDAITDYIRFRTSQDYSKGTINVDRQVLTRMLAVLGNIWCHQITDKHVARHFDEVSKTRSPASLQNDHGVMVRFFKWARHTGRMPVDSDPMYGRRQPRGTKRERHRVPVTDFGRMLDKAVERDPRDRALVAVLLYTLIRDSEATSLRIRDLDLSGGWVRASIHKTRQEDLMPVSSELDAEMRQWLTHYTAKVGGLEPHFFLIPARTVAPIMHPETGKFLKHRSLYKPERQIKYSARIVKQALVDIDFPVTYADGRPSGEGAHTLRRSGARALFDQLSASGYDQALRIVQSMLHHASVTMTEQYLGITADRRSRDEILRGKTMYATGDGASVLHIAR